MADKQTLIEHAKKETQEYKKCPICGHEEWQVSDEVITMSGVTVACVKCGHCGNTVFFQEAD